MWTSRISAPVEKQCTSVRITVDSSAAEWEKKVHFKTKDGLNFSISFQATKVKKPSQPCPRSQKGNRVCFGSSEAHIDNVATGKRTNLELQRHLQLGRGVLQRARVYEAGQEVRNSTKPPKPVSASPCEAEMCAHDVSESEDLDHSAQPSATCGTDGERGGESGARAHKRVQDPRVPTQAEVDEHNMTQVPYGSWCTHCVRGRGEAHPHRKSGEEERDVPGATYGLLLPVQG